MDVVEVVRGVGPGLGGIVDFEFEVGRDPGWLAGGEVGAGYGGGGELVGEIAVRGSGMWLRERKGGRGGQIHHPDS